MIEIKISDKDGKIKVEVVGKGYVGMECIENIEKITSKLGMVLSETPLSSTDVIVRK